MKRNYQIELENELSKISTPRRLLLHACCAPCSSYVLEYLTKYFDITVYFCNPNITDRAEYDKRLSELRRLAGLLPHVNLIGVVDAGYSPEGFLELSKGREELPEGGARCFDCYRLRLTRTAEYFAARRGDFDFFATTLTVSPHKNAEKLNEIGFELSEKYDLPWLPSDFKKREGYKRSIELSRIYSLYRQDYCGCEFSRRQRHGGGAEDGEK